MPSWFQRLKARGRVAESGTSARTSPALRQALRQALLATAPAPAAPGPAGLDGIALAELLSGSVVALEERHASLIYALVVGDMLPAHPPPPFRGAPRRGAFPEGGEGLIEFKIAAFEFVESEVRGEGGPAGGRAPMAMPVAVAREFVQACMAPYF